MADVRGTNLNLLLLFDALLATRSVTLAAKRLGLTQSGASNALAQLRLVFGDPLFERSGRGVRPTALALGVAPDVRAGVEAFTRALRPRTFDPSALQRTFVLAMPEVVQAVLLPDLSARLAVEAPGVRIQVRSQAAQEVPDGLATGDLDLFAGYFSSTPADHGAAPLYDESYVCLLRHGHPALEGERVLLERWLVAGHVVVSAEASGPTAVDRALGDLGLSRVVAARVDNALVVPAIVARTDWVALVDRRWGTLTQHGGVVRAEPPIRLPSSRVRVAWHRRAEADPAVVWLRDRLAPGD